MIRGRFIDREFENYIRLLARLPGDVTALRSMGRDEFRKCLRSAMNAERRKAYSKHWSYEPIRYALIREHISESAGKE